MTVQELIDWLNDYVKHNKRYADFEIVIPLAQPSVGVTACARPTKVYPGIDWDSGKMFLDSPEDLIRKKDR